MYLEIFRVYFKLTLFGKLKLQNWKSYLDSKREIENDWFLKHKSVLGNSKNNFIFFLIIYLFSAVTTSVFYLMNV